MLLPLGALALLDLLLKSLNVLSLVLLDGDDRYLGRLGGKRLVEVFISRLDLVLREALDEFLLLLLHLAGQLRLALLQLLV